MKPLARAYDHPRYKALFEEHLKELLGTAQFARDEGYHLKGSALVFAKMRFLEDLMVAQISANRQLRHLDKIYFVTEPVEEKGRILRRIKTWENWAKTLRDWKAIKRLQA